MRVNQKPTRLKPTSYARAIKTLQSPDSLKNVVYRNLVVFRYEDLEPDYDRHEAKGGLVKWVKKSIKLAQEYHIPLYPILDGTDEVRFGVFHRGPLMQAKEWAIIDAITCEAARKVGIRVEADLTHMA